MQMCLAFFFLLTKHAASESHSWYGTSFPRLPMSRQCIAEYVLFISLYLSVPCLVFVAWSGMVQGCHRKTLCYTRQRGIREKDGSGRAISFSKRVCCTVGTWIIALKPPVNESMYVRARNDVQLAGGQVTYELKGGFKAMVVTLPDEQAAMTFKNKDYVDFVEKDTDGKQPNISFYF